MIHLTDFPNPGPSAFCLLLSGQTSTCVPSLSLLSCSFSSKSWKVTIRCIAITLQCGTRWPTKRLHANYQHHNHRRHVKYHHHHTYRMFYSFYVFGRGCTSRRTRLRNSTIRKHSFTLISRLAHTDKESCSCYSCSLLLMSEAQSRSAVWTTGKSTTQNPWIERRPKTPNRIEINKNTAFCSHLFEDVRGA